MISLARGVPSPDLLPAEPLAEAAARAIERHGRVALNYGEPAGFAPLRERIGAEHGVGPDSVLLTPGSLIALNLLIRRLAEPGARVIVEAPSYDRTLGVLASVGADVFSVAHDDDGLDLDALAGLLADGPRPAFLYLLPTFHNPSGRTLRRAQRERLADLAVAHDLLVVEDDPYGLLRFEGKPEPSVFALLHERGGAHLAVRLSSFSKSVAPGLRVGYVVAPPPLAGSLAVDITPLYLSPPLLAQAQLFEFLDGGMLEPHLEWLRARLRERRDALLEVFEHRLRAPVAWTRPDGGYFLWLELPEPLDAAAILARVGEAGVACVPGDGFHVGATAAHGARLSFSYPPVDELREAAERLATVVAQVTS
jgi:DNA-binding transcriptional MocR family regulator